MLNTEAYALSDQAEKNKMKIAVPQEVVDRIDTFPREQMGTDGRARFGMTTEKSSTLCVAVPSRWKDDYVSFGRKHPSLEAMYAVLALI